MGLPSAVKALIAMHTILYAVALLVSDTAAYAHMLDHVAYSANGVLSGKVWTILTYIPFHVGPDAFGLLFDVIVLWTVGSTFGHRWRRNHFLFFYFCGGMGAAALNLLLALVSPTLFGGLMMGGSGSSFALFAAFLMVFGEMPVSMMGSRPFRGKWVFWGLLGLETLFFVAGTNPHYGLQLGGAATGWLLVTGRWRPNKLKTFLGSLGDAQRRRKREQEKSRFRVIH